MVRIAWVAVLVVAVLVGGCAPPPPVVELPVGSAGGPGPCGVARRAVTNAGAPQFAVTVFEPTGDVAAPTDGRCDDDERPTVLLVHGYLATAPEVYEGLIDHLVAHGHLVVFSPFQIPYDPPVQYHQAWSGFETGVAAAPRADASRLGVVGHSYGGGMAPWILQQSEAAGWGGAATWSVIFAPHYAQLLDDGPIRVPPSTQMLVVAYELDTFVDARIGIEMFHSLTVDPSRKDHLTVLSDRGGAPPRPGTHLGPLSFESLPVHIPELTTDDEDVWVAYRSVDATSGCALRGEWCDTDLADVGTWPGGRPVNRGILTDSPGDRGPVSIQECDLFMNPRPCP